ncbi:MAG: GNAT family N-acetyltransferase [Candidatus Sericytochromatia bacterium]|nr:GNAT family N-acetyltransferase [Candidatus Sericytochromatia bacterium]
MALIARVLGRDDEPLWLPLLTPEALGAPDAGEFASWRSQLLLAARTGLLSLIHVPGGRGLPPAVVAASRPAPGHRAILFGLGPARPAVVQAVHQVLRRDAQLVTITEEAGVAWLEAAVGAGYSPLRHQVFVDHLDRIPNEALDGPLEPAISPWEDEDAAALVAAANAGTVSGLVLCAPQVPTRSGIRDHVRSLASEGGALMREASFVLREAGVALGAVVVTRSEQGPVLYELAVAPEARGRGLGRVLVRAAQRALRAAGHAEMRFHTTDTNAPVHRLYGAGEVELVASWRTACWMAPEVVGEASSRSTGQAVGLRGGSPAGVLGPATTGEGAGGRVTEA